MKSYLRAAFLGLGLVTNVANADESACPTSHVFSYIDTVEIEEGGLQNLSGEFWIAYFKTIDCNGEMVKLGNGYHIGYTRPNVVEMSRDPSVDGDFREQVEKAHETLMGELCTPGDMLLNELDPKLFGDILPTHTCPAAF